MSITGVSTRNELIQIKKDISNIIGVMTENSIKIQELTEKLNSVPYIGNFTFRIQMERTGAETIGALLVGTNKHGVGSGVSNMSYNVTEKRFSAEYSIPTELQGSSYSESKLVIRPQMVNSKDLVVDLNFTYTAYWEDSHIELRVTKIDNTKCRIDMYFYRTDLPIEFISEHMTLETSRLDVDWLILDYN